MPFEFIQVKKRGHLTTVTICRPERMNAIHPYTTVELDEAFGDFQNDPDQWVAIVTGAGDRAFSAGNDLKYQAEHGSANISEITKDVKGGFAGIHKRTDLFKPLIAAVNGFALGGGFEIVLSCDIIIAAEHAKFGLPEPKVGLMAGAGGVHRLPRHIPYHLAMGMMLTGRHISAQEAQSYGLVNEIVPLDDLIPTAERWAEEILACAPLSIRASKEATNRALCLPLDEALLASYPGMKAMRDSEDLIEGPKAFAEKRPPNWKGQ